jgi:phosphate transport system protein
MSQPPQGILAGKLELISEESRLMLSQAIAAFKDGNAEAAKATKGMAAQIDHAFSSTFSDLTSEESGVDLKDLMRLFNIFHRLERVAAQAKNICEETLFAVAGETKAPKVYRILFLDEDNSGLSQMAEAIAQRNFPSSGHYTSAGRYVGTALNPALVEFMQARGFDLSEAHPKPLDMTASELSELHVIVSLQGAVKNYIPEIPFHTVAMEWDVGTLPTELNPEQTQQRQEELYREIAVRVQDLMQTLRGTGAS